MASFHVLLRWILQRLDAKRSLRIAFMSALGNYCQIREILSVMAGWSYYYLPAKNKRVTILNISPIQFYGNWCIIW